MCVTLSASNLHGLPGLKPTEQEREEPSEECPEETEEERAMAAQSAGAGAGEQEITQITTTEQNTYILIIGWVEVVVEG